MGKQVTVQIVDDLDGAVLDEYETVTWAVDGKAYEFDTSPKNAEKFRTVLAKYRDASRRSGRTVASARTATPTRPADQTRAIRQWATSNGFEVNARGRIPTDVVEAFDAAH